ncbi:MAG: RHS repeat domain-containing protein, partial [Planctomycetota bacterium]
TFGEGGKSIVFKKFYDALGRNDLNEGPFFATGVGYPLNPSDAYPWQQTTSDLRGRPEAIESADGEYGSVVATFSYSGLSTTIIDPDGGSKTEQKDYLGRVIQVIEHADGANYTTTYSYNAAGDLLTVNDHYNNTTTINYDTLGRKISMNDPDMGYWEYAYDANGNLLTQLDEKLQTIEFKYDELNRVTSKTYSTSDPAVNYAYDNLTIPNGRGQLYTVSNTQVTTTYDAYDVMGNVTSVSKTIIGDDTVYTTQYEYDLIGRLLKTIYPDGYEATQHYYSGSGLLEAVRDPQARLLAHMSNYTPGGKVGRIEYRNTVITEYAYDPESTRLLSIVTNGPPIVSNHSVNALVGIGNPGQSTSTVGMPAMGTAGTGQSSPMAGVPAPATNPYYQSKSYKYTPSGNIKEIIDNVEGVSFYYTYDKLHRLKAETNTGSYNPISYTYNAIGNITSKTVGTGTFHYTYDDWHKHAVKTINLNGFDFQYEYDDNGNMTSGPDFSDPLQVATRTISYNADNMPTSISHVKGTTTVTTNYIYDGDGVRSKKSILGGSTTYYIGGHFEIKDGVSTKYIFAGNLRIAKVDASGTHYFHKDHLGSSTVMTDAAGAVVETTDYMPFGSQRNRTGADVSVYKFTDQEFDSESGLYNYNARLYDPKLGIFITPDSIVPDFSDPQSLNRYSYCRNNPLIYADPSGHNPFIVGAIVGAAVGTLSAGAQSNWDAGAMLQGAALGAITGAISAGSFFAAGEIIQAGILTCPITGIEVQTLTAVEQALIHAAAGAFSGGINSGIAGGDIGLGMLTGAASAGIGKFAGGYLPSNRMWQYGGRAAIAGGVGGVAHSISGGNFWTGAAWGAGTAAFGYTFNELWHELYPDWGVHPNIRSISAGGKAPGIGTDTHYDAYTRGKGTMTLEKSQSLTANIVAVGATTTFDRLSWFQADKSLPNIQTDIGLGNYLGFSFNRHQGTIMVNIGVAANLFNMMGSPVAISVPLNP